ncbi:uncharacterized protein LOC136030190 isoform X2 [Artemia franciscana]
MSGWNSILKTVVVTGSGAAAFLLYRLGSTIVKSGFSNRISTVSEALQSHYNNSSANLCTALPGLDFTKLNFHSLLAELCHSLCRTDPLLPNRALEIYSSVGSGCFELAKYFRHVIGVEERPYLFVAAAHLKSVGKIVYSLPAEGESTETKIASIPSDIIRERVEFILENPSNLPSDVGEFACVLIADSLTSLPNPKAVIEHICGFIVDGGFLVVASTNNWSKIPKDLWIGGKGNKKGDSTFEVIDRLLEKSFERFPLPGNQNQLAYFYPKTTQIWELRIPKVAVWKKVK